MRIVRQCEDLLKLVKYQHRVFPDTALLLLQNRLPVIRHLYIRICGRFFNLTADLLEIPLCRIVFQTDIHRKKVLIPHPGKYSGAEQGGFSDTRASVYDSGKIVEDYIRDLFRLLIPSIKTVMLRIRVKPKPRIVIYHAIFGLTVHKYCPQMHPAPVRGHLSYKMLHYGHGYPPAHPPHGCTYRRTPPTKGLYN